MFKGHWTDITGNFSLIILIWCVCFNVNYDGLITAKFCNYHYRCLIKACAKNYHDLTVRNLIKITILFPLCLNFDWKIIGEICPRSIMESSGLSLISLMDCIYLITLIFNPSSTGTHFTKGLWAHNSNLVKILVALILILMILSGHNFAHAMAAELSWHVQNYDLI